MDDFARRSVADRRVYIEEAASKRDLTPIIIEKDFWVCWTLRRLMGCAGLEENFTFKGGTSLSKAYGIIHRFSEAISGVLAARGGQCRDNGCSHAETSSQSTRHIVLPASFPNPKLSGRMDPAFPGIETKHDLAQRNQIVSAVFLRP